MARKKVETVDTSNDTIKAMEELAKEKEIDKETLFEAIENLYNDNDPMLEVYAKLLYDQALLIEGIMPKNPVEVANQIANFMSK